MAAKMSKSNNIDSEYVTEIVESGSVIAEKEETDFTYSKRQFLNSEKYKKYRDLLSVLLDNNKFYRKLEVNKLIDDYLKRKVR